MAMNLDIKEMEELHWKHHLLGSIEVGIIVLNRQFEIVIWNEFMENHSGVSPSSVKGKVLFDSFPEINQHWFKRKADAVFNLNTPSYIIYEQRPYLLRFPSPRPVTGSDEFMYQNVTIFPLSSLKKTVDNICVIIYDVSNEVASKQQLALANQQLQYLSQHDGMTQLYNRQYWESRFKQEYSRSQRTVKGGTLLMLDIDHFKRINDTYGHSAGDDVIRALAAILKRSIRSTDIAGRYGGEEFCVLLNDTQIDGAMYVAEKIRKRFSEQQVSHEDQIIRSTISIGIASYKNDLGTYVEWLNLADSALYEAKNAGRNCIKIA